MPWTVQRDKRCNPGRPWSVVVQGTNELVACHPTRRKALRQSAALYANEPEASRMTKKTAPEPPAEFKKPEGIETRVASEMWVDAGIEIRRKPDSMRVEGYAAVFGQKSLPMPFVETFRAGSFARSLGERPVKMFLNHNDNIVLGYTKAGTLRVGEDSRGLAFDGDLPENEWGRPVADAIDRGDIDNMSFTFKASRDAWSDGYQSREVIEARLFEISPITAWAAYPSTSIARRSLQDLAGYLLADVDALQAAIGKLANGEPLMCQEADLLEAAIAHLEPPDEDDMPMQMNASPTPLLTEWRARLGEMGLIEPVVPA